MTATIEQARPKRPNNSSGAQDEIEFGSFTPDGAADISAARNSKLVIASFNIRYAVGSFLITGSLFRRAGLRLARRRPSLVARHLQRAARALTDGRLLPPVDILALQEADKGTLRAGRAHVARELAGKLRMNYAHAAANLPRDERPKPRQWYLDFEEQIEPAETGDTGIALLSRLPLSAVERVELPWSECAWRPRLAIHASLHVGAHRLHIFNSHIDPHATTEEQLAQHESILSRADELEGPVVLLGDFNTLTRASCIAMRGLLESRGYRSPFETGTATWRAGLIRLHTDWIFVRGLRVDRYGVARPLGVSDHWPVWVEIDFEGDGGAR